jgi:hypothetical protein
LEAFIANTHYGVRNYLKIKSYQALDTRVFKLSLSSDKPSIKEKLESSESAPLNLFILFLSPCIVRFHYAFSDSFDLNINPLLDFSSYGLSAEIGVREQSHDCTVAERASSRRRRTNDRNVRVISSDAEDASHVSGSYPSKQKYKLDSSSLHEDHEDDENAGIGVPQQCND